MKYNREIHHRQSNRLPGYDYSQAGAYFLTICTHERECLFGEINSGQMIMNDLGYVVAEEWVKTGEMRTNVQLDVWVVMPNHFHGIVMINNGTLNDPVVGARRVVPLFKTASMCRDGLPEQGTARCAPTEQFGKPVRGSIPTIVRSFKSAVTKRVNVLRQTPGLPLWQRNYWDHVIRNEADLNRIREYVSINPLRWELDTLREGSQ